MKTKMMYVCKDKIGRNLITPELKFTQIGRETTIIENVKLTQGYL